MYFVLLLAGDGTGKCGNDLFSPMLANQADLKYLTESSAAANIPTRHKHSHSCVVVYRADPEELVGACNDELGLKHICGEIQMSTAASAQHS